MRGSNRFVTIAAVAVSFACGATQDLPTPTLDVNAHVAEWVEFWGTYDLSKLDDLFLADATYLSSEREGLIVGLDALREHHAGFGFVDGGFEQEQELWVEDVQASAFESSAVVTAVWFFGDRGAPREGVSRGPMTAVYVWTDDGFKIAHMQFGNYESS